MMSKSLLQLLDQKGHRLTVVTPTSFVPLVRLFPEVEHVIPFSNVRGRMGWKSRYQLGRFLKEKGFEEAYVLPNSWKSALIPFFANIPRRIGWRGEMRYGLLNVCNTLDTKRFPKMVERYAALGDSTLPAPRPHLELRAADKAEFLEKHRVGTHQRIVAMCIGGAYGETKRWPPNYFGRVAKGILDKGDSVWLLGGNEDLMSATLIQEMTENRCNNFVGITSLAEATILLSMANVVLTNDSGLMHISAALDRPLVAIYGATSPTFTPPLSEQVIVLQKDLPCVPCWKRHCSYGHLRCLQELFPHEVLSAVENVLSSVECV